MHCSATGTSLVPVAVRELNSKVLPLKRLQSGPKPSPAPHQGPKS
jgi:hypothetical protein